MLGLDSPVIRAIVANGVTCYILHLSDGCPPHPAVSDLVRLEREVEPGSVLEHQAPLLPVDLATNDDERGGEADDLEVLGQLGRAPDLPVLGFQSIPWNRVRH